MKRTPLAGRRSRIAHAIACWYWRRSPSTRRAIDEVPNWLLAFALGLSLAYLAAQGF